MATKLELIFVTESGEPAVISVDNPKEPVDPSAVREAMNDLVASNAFYTSKGNLAGIKGARLVDRQVTEYEIVS